MVWLWILLAAVLLAVLLCRMRLGVWAAYDGTVLRLDARVGLLRIHILPPKAGKPPSEKPAKKGEQPAKPDKQKNVNKFSFTLEDGRDALRTLLPPLKRALDRTRRGIRIKPLRLSLTLGGQDDPAAAGELCGKIQAAVWSGMPLLEKLVDIREPRIHTGVDFGASGPAGEGEAGVTLRLGTLLAAGFGLLFPALRWFLRWRKRCKARRMEEEKPETAGEEPAA